MKTAFLWSFCLSLAILFALQGESPVAVEPKEREWARDEIGWINLAPDPSGDVSVFCYKLNSKEEYQEYYNSGDDDALHQMIGEGKLILVPHGTRIRIVTPGEEIEIRVEEGEHEGWTGFLMKKHVSRSKPEQYGPPDLFGA